MKSWMKSAAKSWWGLVSGLGLACLLTSPGHAVLGAEADAVGLDEAPKVEVTRTSKASKSDTSLKELFGMGIGFTAVTLGIGIGMLAIWTEYRKRRDLIDMIHKERMAALEKGIELPEIPASLLRESSSQVNAGPSSPTKGLKAGLIWLFTGISVTAFFFMEGGMLAGRWHGPNPALGGIPISIGLVNLLCYWVERRTRKV